MIIFYLVVLIFFLYLIFWQLNLIYSMMRGAPIVYANMRAIADCYKLAKLKRGELVVDLGCGDGKSLRIAVRQFGARGIGIERSPYAYAVARLKKLLHRNKTKTDYEIIFSDFKKAEKYLKKADVVYLYLLNNVVQKHESWLFETIPKDCRVVSLAFPFVRHQPIKTAVTKNLGIETKIYLYSKVREASK